MRNIFFLWAFYGLLISSVNLFAQDGFTWYRTYGSSNSESASTAALTADGGMIIAGTTNHFSPGSSDIYLVKCNTDGEEEWSTYYIRDGLETCGAITETEDGGYLLVGSWLVPRHGNYSNSDGFLLRLNPNGETLWDRTYGSGRFTCIHPLQDGGYALTGYLEGEGHGSGWIMIVNENGIPRQSIRLEGYTIVDTELTPEEDIVLLGSDLMVRKVDLDGEEIWQVDVGVDRRSYRDYRDIALTSDGGIIIPYGDIRDSLEVTKVSADGEIVWVQIHNIDRIRLGYTRVIEVEEERLLLTSAYSRPCLIKLNSEGELMWGGDIGINLGDSYQASNLKGLFYDAEHRYRVVGTAYAYRSHYDLDSAGDIMMAKLDQRGDLITSGRFGFPGGSHESGRDILLQNDIPLEDGILIILANTTVTPGNYSSPLIMGLSENGDSLWSHIFGIPQNEYVTRILQPTDSTWIVGGRIDGENYQDKWWLTKFNRDFNQMWRREYACRYRERKNDMILTSNGGVLMVGGGDRDDEGRAILLSDNGSLLGSLTDEPGPFISAVELDENHFAILAADCEVLIVDEDLEVVDWIDAGVPHTDSSPYDMTKTEDDDLLVLGYASDNREIRNMYVTRMTLEGECLWLTYQPVRNTNHPHRLFVLEDGGIYYCQPMYIFKLDEFGRTESSFRTIRSQDRDDGPFFYGYHPLEEGGMLCVGEYAGDILVAHWDDDATLVPILSPGSTVPSFLNVVASPNPFNAFTTISYKIANSGRATLALYDLQGRLLKDIFNGFRLPGKYSCSLNAFDLTSGVYVVQLTTETNGLSKKIVLTR
ncbi:MAG: T9SS type A sorting domain-containing protein [Candidatus Hatepunaea meridiana]|nr:T9SS type A sorting domain-containing protein [Candidatus Hatepunaea meridiana]